ncbi:MAG: fimbria/pilus periplasmic chaperone [Clostridia bacterium]|nr:fimbria/pilus periplasmic chaperone [Clostridia bacterium]
MNLNLQQLSENLQLYCLTSHRHNKCQADAKPFQVYPSLQRVQTGQKQSFRLLILSALFHRKEHIQSEFRENIPQKDSKT